MKTRLIFLTALIALSCAKTPEKEKTFFETLPADGMVFNASNVSGPSSKSHLLSDNATDGTLYWSADDAISVYAYKADDFSSVAANAYINPSAAGHTSAEFKSIKTSEEWFGGESKAFFAHYPNNGFPLVVQEGYDKDVLPLPVPNYQTGNYVDHQVMFAYAGTKSPGDPVSFEFSPLAPILRFRFKSIDGTSCEIGKISLELGMTVADNSYYNREPGETLAEQGRKRLSGHIVIDIEETISNNAVTVVEEPNSEGYGGYVILELARAGKVITVGSDWSDPVFAAVIPTKGPEPNMLFAVSAIRFDDDHWDEQDAFTKGGTGIRYGEVYSAIKTLSTLPNGFESGKLYDFAITLNNGRMDVGNLSTYELGSYNIINWGLEE